MKLCLFFITLCLSPFGKGSFYEGLKKVHNADTYLYKEFKCESENFIETKYQESTSAICTQTQVEFYPVDSTTKKVSVTLCPDCCSKGILFIF